MKKAMLLISFLVVHAVTSLHAQDLDRFILMAEGYPGRLLRMDLDSGRSVDLPINVTTPAGVDYDVMDERVYWSDDTEEIIGSARLDGSGYNIVRQLNSDAYPELMELDASARLLFYSDSGNDVIASMNLDGSNHREILNSTLDEPRGLALDIEDRVVYYTDAGRWDKIARISYEGTDHQILVTSSLSIPTGLALDKKASRLYWCDAGMDRIESIKTDGSDRRLLLQKTDTSFWGIDLYNGYLYISDVYSRNLYRMRADGTGFSAFGASVLFYTRDIHIVDKEQALQAIRGDSTTPDGMLPPSTSQKTSGFQGGDSTTPHGVLPSSTSPKTSEPAGGDSTTPHGVLPSSTSPKTSEPAAPHNLISTIAGSAIGAFALINIIVVVVIVLVFRRRQQRARNEGRAHYQARRDSNYAHLQEPGWMPPPHGQVNVTSASEEHPYDLPTEPPPDNIVNNVAGNPPPNPNDTLYLTVR